MSAKRELPTAEGGPGGERCVACYFWSQMFPGALDPSEGSDDPWGFCRRYPPTLRDRVPLRDAEDYEQPRTFADEWCGEWKAKPAAKP